MVGTMLPEDTKPKVADIFAAQKIIADISSGLYRSPAAALKELVSNAYDADADAVEIQTDPPSFRQLVVSDNGSGMPIEEFLDVLRHIGGSRKRLGTGVSPIKHRKLIGRIGIGLLAVAQLGYRFYVTSSVKGSASRFIAEVDLEPFHGDDAALMSMGKMRQDGQVHIGAVRYVDGLSEEPDAHYTVITIPDAKRGLISDMTSDIRMAIGAEEKASVKSTTPLSFQELIEITRSSKRADTDLDGYYYMAWELGLLCPVDYLEEGPFDIRLKPIEGMLDVDVPRISDFRVIVDQLQIRRPQLFPSNIALSYAGPSPKLYSLKFDRDVSGRRLSFTGYVLTQQPRVDPEELRGLHVRIRNVGIGKYDRTWLGYPFNEGQKFAQITGEVFVDQGLEPALNIDRDSFRETDVHYQALRAFIWETLRKRVFPDFKLRQKHFSFGKRTQQHATQHKLFRDRLLMLPAPLVDTKQIVASVDGPALLGWIAIDGDKLVLVRDGWEAFASNAGLSTDESCERFLRVLTALLSGELLVGMEPEELEPLLFALAAALQ